ncbi:TIGR03086 family metal-binding protein [Goodfellowiella coeruleoviolacea]|uniref:TIGR03086 family protein n=1 Tax=Goodfellowiella coeruleoviolacea TaxID=334858 RepID=A0AAE3KK04_9PSEU|nr:TIGR03086 family metal-binding protein [Goodfellowiella coeruleoviolacea]MCP2164918.1 TIGR03086 family protein [Goodfellowiella coeruleoviolacea]
MIDLEPACQRMTDLLAGITADQLTAPTPCTEYRVGDLVDHIDQVATMFTAIAQRDSGGLPDDGDLVAGGDLAHSGDLPENDGTSDTAHRGPDWRNGVDRHVRALGTAWGEPAAWAGSTDVSGLELANELWGRIALTELVVHGWDLATATGQPFDLPEPTLRACLDHVVEFVPNAPLPELWGPPVAVAADAPLLDRIVAVTGRTP